MDWINFFILMFLIYIFVVQIIISDKLSTIHSQTMFLSRPLIANITLDKDFNIIHKEVKDGE